MRKGLFLVIVLMLLVSRVDAMVAETVYEVRIRNDSGEPKFYSIPVTTIRPEVDKFVGYEVMPLTSGNTETYVVIFDSTSALVIGEILGEKEAAAGWSAGDWFGERPKKIANGVSLRQGAFTEAVVYFIRR